MIILNAIAGLPLIAPEVFILSMTLLVMMVDLFMPKTASISPAYVLTQVTLILAFILLLILGFGGFFEGQFLADRLSFLLGLGVVLSGFFSFFYGKQYHDLHRIAEGEFYSLGLLSILGALVLVSSASLLTLYLGLELLSLPLYALIALRRDSIHSVEAAMKYFVMGSIASAFLLYGFSLIYGLTGSFELSVLAQQSIIFSPPVLCALMFMLLAVGFKLGVVPFHAWVADGYQGSPTSVTIFLGTIPKIAALGLFFRLFTETFASMQTHWAPVLIMLGIASLFIGNMLAIAQTNLKRLLAYSTIAHMGFLFLALGMGNAEANHAALFYLAAYLVSVLAAFGLILFMSRLGTDADTLEDLKGLNRNHPWLSFMFLLVILSMAGVPPLLGFDAKLFILKALLQEHHLGLLLYALVMSVIAMGYYLRVIKVIYFDESGLNAHFASQNRDKLSVFNGTGLVLSLNSLLLLILGIFPNGFYEWF